MISNSVIKAPLNIRVQAGDTFTRRFTFIQDDAPLDLTGYELKLQVKDTSGTQLFVWLNADFTLISTGIYQVTKSAAAMNVTPDNYIYDLQITYPSGEQRTWMYGNFEIYNQTTS